MKKKLFEINYFFVFSNCFDILILKIFFLKKNIILMHFRANKYFEKQSLSRSKIFIVISEG
jgi:hypothetical protein